MEDRVPTSFYGSYPEDVETQSPADWNVENIIFKDFIYEQFYWRRHGTDATRIQNLVDSLNANKMDPLEHRVIKAPLLVGLPVNDFSMLLIVIFKLSTTSNAPGKISAQSYSKHKVALVNLDGSLIAIPTPNPLMCLPPSSIAGGPRIVRSSQGNANKWLIPQFHSDKDELVLTWIPIRNLLGLRSSQATSDIINKLEFSTEDWPDNFRPKQLLLYNHKDLLYKPPNPNQPPASADVSVDVYVRSLAIPSSSSVPLNNPEEAAKSILELNQDPSWIVKYNPPPSVQQNNFANSKGSGKSLRSRDSSPVRRSSPVKTVPAVDRDGESTVESSSDSEDENVLRFCRNLIDQRFNDSDNLGKFRVAKLQTKLKKKTTESITQATVALEQRMSTMMDQRLRQIENDYQTKLQTTCQQLENDFNTKLANQVEAYKSLLERQKADFELCISQLHPQPTEPLTPEQILMQVVQNQASTIQSQLAAVARNQEIISQLEDKLSKVLAEKNRRRSHNRRILKSDS